MRPRLQNIKGTSNWLYVIVGVFMLSLTIFDLIWLMFDALYTTQSIQNLIDPIFPFYKTIHSDFYFYDGIIVSIFITEFLIRWSIAIWKKLYDKWFFYPFIHWYDVLGCFPTSSFRILRLFRIIGLTYRLHQWGVIDLKNYAIFNTGVHYYNIIIEEISDRVVVKVLTEAKEEIRRGQPLSDAIAQQILQPKKSELALLISQVIQEGIRKKYPQYRTLLRKHILKNVQDAVRNNAEVKQLERIPLIGNQIQTALHTATSEIVFGVIDRLIQDASDSDSEEMMSLILESILEVLLEQQTIKESALATEIILESIDLIVDRVNIKQWKHTE